MKPGRSCPHSAAPLFQLNLAQYSFLLLHAWYTQCLLYIHPLGIRLHQHLKPFAFLLVLASQLPALSLIHWLSRLRCLQDFLLRRMIEALVFWDFEI
ncbi:hypothetical protein BKA93DRAFT_61311 [Sparassis latifolia]